MKRFLAIVFAAFVLLTAVHAEEVLPDDSISALPEAVDSVVDSVSDLVDTATSQTAPGESPSEVSPGGNTIYVLNQPSETSESEVDLNAGTTSSDPVLTDVTMLTGLAPVTPSDATGFKAVLLGLIGNYDPPVVQFEYTTNNNYKQYVNEIQPDYVWLCSCGLLALMIFCLFRLGGALLRG